MTCTPKMSRYPDRTTSNSSLTRYLCSSWAGMMTVSCPPESKADQRQNCEADEFVLIYLECISFFFFFKFYLFIFGCVGSSLLHAGFLSLRRARATLHCGVQASHCGGLSCCGTQAPGMRASAVVAHGLSNSGLRALEHRLSSCGSRA